MAKSQQERSRQYEAAHREQRNAAQRANRKKARLAEERYRAKHRSNLNRRRRESYAQNPAIEAFRWKQYADKNAEKLRAYYRAKSHFRRAGGWDTNRKVLRTVILELLEEARFGDQYLDAYSGQLISKPTIDHVVSIKAGGTNDRSNLCVTSFRNNRSKGISSLIV